MNTVVNVQYYSSPCGELVLASVGEELCLCDWNEKTCAEHNKRRLVRLLNATFVTAPSTVLLRAKKELDEYFANKRTEFDIPLRPVGTNFQCRVWRALQEVPYGETRSYKEIALRVGNPKGIRAVAQAIGANGISIFIPCHRIIGTNGALTGFAGGIDAKRMLLNIESRESSLF